MKVDCGLYFFLKYAQNRKFERSGLMDERMDG